MDIDETGVDGAANAELLCEKYKNTSNGTSHWLLEIFMNWTLSSPIKLRNAEKFILSHLRNGYRGFFIDIGSVVGQADQIWTIGCNMESKEMPLVVLHGLGSGLALWVLNLDALAKERPVYAIDLLGFGRSSRPQFSTKPTECEQQLADSFEEWRREMKLSEFILLGHSMGSYVACNYALRHPTYLRHLILVDPWGFIERPQTPARHVPLWVRIIGRISLYLNPYWIMRAVGPFGACTLRAATEEVFKVFEPIFGKNIDMLTQYMHQCNAIKPSGEAAFHTLSEYFAFAKRPMVYRMRELCPRLGITFIFGSRSWVDARLGIRVKTIRQKSFVDINVIDQAGHNVMLDQPQQFNDIVVKTCERYGNSHKELSPVSLQKEPCKIEELVKLMILDGKQTAEL